MKNEDALVVLELPSITTLTLSALEKARDEKIRLFQPSEADSDQKWKILEAYDILDDYLHGKRSSHCPQFDSLDSSNYCFDYQTQVKASLPQRRRP